MQTINAEQRSPEWYAARQGLFTASEFKKIITPTGAKSKQIPGLVLIKIAEELLSSDCQNFNGNHYTERGNDLEPEAVSTYEFINGETQEAFFYVADCGYYGCTPDRLVGDDGLLEIKCVNSVLHVQYMLEKKPYSDYYPQIQGQLLVTGRKWVDFMAYHPELPPVIRRVARDDAYIEKLEEYLWEANQLLESEKTKLKGMGYL